MKFKTKIRASLIASLLSFTVTAYADAICPPVELIQQSASKLNKAMPADPNSPNKYYVMNENTVFTDLNNHAWYVTTYPIIANTSEEALAKGQDNVANTKFETFSRLEGDYYVCFYSAKVAPVIILTDVKSSAPSILRYRPVS